MDRESVFIKFMRDKAEAKKTLLTRIDGID